MLVLGRKIGEEVVIGDSIRVFIVDVRGDRVRLGFEAPREVPIYREESQKTAVMETVARMQRALTDASIRVHIDDREGQTPGFKFNDWEMRGVPIRMEIGPKDVEKESVALARRDVPGREGKQFVPQAGIADTVQNLLDEIQANLLAQATAFRDANLHEVGSDYQKLGDTVQNGGWALAWFCGGADCEEKVKADHQCVSRCFPLEQPHPGETGKCAICGQEAHEMAYFARSY